MAIAVMCATCGKSLSAPDTAAGKNVKCPKCGGLIRVAAKAQAPKAVAKICAKCGVDVANQKRTKDAAGRYFCQPCWDVRVSASRSQARAAGQGFRPATAPLPTASTPSRLADSGGQADGSGTVTCPACGRDVPADDMTTDASGAAICWPCQNEVDEPVNLAAAGPAQEEEPPQPAPALVSMPLPGGSVAGSNGLLLKKLGFLAMSLGILGFFAIWPMYQVSQHVPSISISFKGIVLGAMSTPIALASVIFGDKAIRWKKDKKDPARAVEKIVIGGAVLTGFALAGFVYYFIDSHGYKIKW